jgi:hypothetical protein
MSTGPRLFPIRVSDKKLQSILTNPWSPNEMTNVSFFDSFTVETWLFTSPTPRLSSLLQTLATSPPFSLGLVSDTSQKFRFVVVGSALGLAVVDADVDISSFFDLIRDYVCHGVAIEQHIPAIQAYFKVPLRGIDVDALPDFASVIESAKGTTPNFELLESHVVSEGTQHFTLRDVLSAALPTVFAQYFAAKPDFDELPDPLIPAIPSLSPALVVAPSKPVDDEPVYTPVTPITESANPVGSAGEYNNRVGDYGRPVRIVARDSPQPAVEPGRSGGEYGRSAGDSYLPARIVARESAPSTVESGRPVRYGGEYSGVGGEYGRSAGEPFLPVSIVARDSPQPAMESGRFGGEYGRPAGESFLPATIVARESAPPGFESGRYGSEYGRSAGGPITPANITVRESGPPVKSGGSVGPGGDAVRPANQVGDTNRSVQSVTSAKPDPEFDDQVSRTRKKITPPPKDIDEVGGSRNRFVWTPESDAREPPKKPASRPPEPQPPDPDDEDDDAYFAFIASSIRSDGIQVKERAKLPVMAPVVAPAMIKEKVDAAPEFWEELEMLEAILRGTNQVAFDGQFPRCTTCEKKFSSAAKLLHHCWSQHRGTLNEFAFT